MDKRERLLQVAEALIEDAYAYAGDRPVTSMGAYAAAGLNAKANLAQACIALAKEMREAVETPTVVQFDNLTQRLSEVQLSISALR